jgi:site-specific recombinase XerD
VNILTYVALLKKVGYKRLGLSFLGNFGFLWLLFEPLGLFVPNKLDFGWYGYSALVGASLIGAVFHRFPRVAISCHLPSPDTMIEMKIGDLFEQPGHLVVGTNDVFDTELGDIIKPSSIQGQFLTRIYKDDRASLDKDIETAIGAAGNQATEDLAKMPGKRMRYPVGTAITLGSQSTRYFLTAYGRMGNDLRCTADANALWLSLNGLWEEIRLRGQGMNVVTPILGSDLARTGLPRMALIKLIVMSFIIASKKQFIARKLTIVIHPNDVDAVNLYLMRTPSANAKSLSSLKPVIAATQKLWRQHHLTYDQARYVAKEVRRTLRLERPKQRKRVVARLSRDEETRLIAHAYRMRGERGLLIKTLFQTGARVAEFVNIKAEDVFFDEQMVLIAKAKGGKSRYVPILSSLAQELRTHLGDRTMGYLFETNRHTPYSPRRIQQIIKETAADAQITKRVYPHLLRHSVASTLLERGMTLEQIQKFLGHAKLETTQIYAESTTEMIRESYRRAMGAE